MQNTRAKDRKQDHKQLLKILIGAAWIDGKVQPQERHYLHQIAQEHGLADDPDLKPLLYELRDVKPDECYRWLEDYLGTSPSRQDYQCLIEAISALIYSDGDVATEEAKLLTRLQTFDPASRSSLEKLLKTVQDLYRRCIE